MTPLLHGFADELLKLAAYPQQHEDPDPYAAANVVSTAMSQYAGPEAKVGLKTGQPIPTEPAVSKRAPTPLTTPNQMVDYASRE